MQTLPRPLLVLLVPFVESLSGEDEVSALWCPAEHFGNKCLEPSYTSYYKCCGPLHKTCCSHMRLWVLFLIIALPIVLIPLVAYLLRRIFCRQQSHVPTIAHVPRVEALKDTAL